MVGHPDALMRLLSDVEEKVAAYPPLQAPERALDLDVVCAVVEGHLEGCARPVAEETSPDTVRGTRRAAHGESDVVGPQSVSPTDSDRTLSVTAHTRLRLAIAALRYLVDPDDVIPDSHRHGLDDDIAVLRWVSSMVRIELPV